MNNMIIKDGDLYSKNSSIVQLLDDLDEKEQELADKRIEYAI